MGFLISGVLRKGLIWIWNEFMLSTKTMTHAGKNEGSEPVMFVNR